MGTGVSFTICAMLFSILLIIVYFSKERLKSIENKIFVTLIVSNLIGLILEASNFWAGLNYIAFPITSMMFLKGYLLYFLFWTTVFTIYVFVITDKNKDINSEGFRKRFKEIIIMWTIPAVIVASLIVILPLEVVIDGAARYSEGPAVNVMYAYGTFLLILWAVKTIVNFKTLQKVKAIPVFALLVFSILVVIIQAMNPGLILLATSETLICFLMFFTIENPDMKMLNQIKEANKDLEKANEQIEKQMVELEESQDLIVKQAQLVTLGELAGGMAHDINTPISAINNGMSILYKKGTDDPQTQVVYDTIQTCVDKIIGIVNSMRDQIRNLGTKVNEYFKAEDVINDIKIVASNELKAANCNLDIDIQDSVTLYGEKIKLHQVVANIVINSIQAYSSKNVTGDIKVVLKKVGSNCIIEISDCAGGIAPRIREDLFKKILTTKGTKGTGLGLYMSYSIVKGIFNGDIEVETKMDEGTKFFITIPIRTKEQTAEIAFNELQKEVNKDLVK